MIVGKSSAVIRQAVDQVFRFVVVDFATNHFRRSPEVQRLDVLKGGPLRASSRARQIRIDQGRRSDTCFQVTALKPMHKVCFSELS